MNISTLQDAGTAIRPVPLDQFSLDGLDPSLHEFVDRDGPYGPIFDHPLFRDIHLRFTAARPAHECGSGVVIPAGLAAINQIIEEKTRHRDAAALLGQYRDYVFVHHRPYRVSALTHVVRRHGASRFWHLVRDVWTDCEDNMAARDEWDEIWSHAYTPCGGFRKTFARDIMGAADRRVFDALPDTFTVYRGYRKAEHACGYSWTLDESQAEWFALRGRGAGFVAKLTVHKSVALAYFNCREESEIVLDVNYIDDDPDVMQVTPVSNIDREAA